MSLCQLARNGRGNHTLHGHVFEVRKSSHVQSHLSNELDTRPLPHESYLSQWNPVIAMLSLVNVRLVDFVDKEGSLLCQVLFPGNKSVVSLSKAFGLLSQATQRFVPCLSSRPCALSRILKSFRTL